MGPHLGSAESWEWRLGGKRGTHKQTATGLGWDYRDHKGGNEEKWNVPIWVLVWCQHCGFQGETVSGSHWLTQGNVNGLEKMADRSTGRRKPSPYLGPAESPENWLTWYYSVWGFSSPSPDAENKDYSRYLKPFPHSGLGPNMWLGTPFCLVSFCDSYHPMLSPHFRLTSKQTADALALLGLTLGMLLLQWPHLSHISITHHTMKDGLVPRLHHKKDK